MPPKILKLPISEDTIRELKMGDEILVSGTMLTARDVAHKLMTEDKPTFLHEYLNNSIIYHCGPVIRETNGKYKFVAAGPTTSIREEPYESHVINHYKVRGIIGKGGMGQQTLDALQKYGAVYLHATGGAAPLLAQCVTSVKDVFMLKEFGVPEAMWLIEVKDFPVFVTMVSHGNSLHKMLSGKSKIKRDAIFKSL